MEPCFSSLDCGYAKTRSPCVSANRTAERKVFLGGWTWLLDDSSTTAFGFLMICILYYIAPSLSQPNVCLSTKWLHTCYFRRKSFTTRRVYSLTLYSSFHSPHGPCYLARFEPFVEPQGQPTLFMVRYMVVSLGHLAISDIASFYVSFCLTNVQLTNMNSMWSPSTGQKRSCSKTMQPGELPSSACSSHECNRLIALFTSQVR